MNYPHIWIDPPPRIFSTDNADLICSECKVDIRDVRDRGEECPVRLRQALDAALSRSTPPSES
jgi:hypothetical protein